MAADRRRPPRLMSCAQCGVPFRLVAPTQKTCSDECRFLLYQNAGATGDCWNWTGGRNSSGYGALSAVKDEGGLRKTVQAHRYSFIRSGGVLTDEAPCVLHRCDNRLCTNPAHLFAGNWDDNNKDRSRKGRSGKKQYSDADKAHYSELFRGHGNPCAKLTEDAARAIKYKHPEMSASQLGALYGVSKSAVKFIRSGRSWRHV